VDDDPGVLEQAFARRGQLNAAAAALQKRNAKRCFQALDPRARRRQREMARSAPRVILRSAATAINSWRSTRSKRMAIAEAPCLRHGRRLAL